MGLPIDGVLGQRFPFALLAFRPLSAGLAGGGASFKLLAARDASIVTEAKRHARRCHLP